MNCTGLSIIYNRIQSNYEKHTKNAPRKAQQTFQISEIIDNNFVDVKKKANYLLIIKSNFISAIYEKLFDGIEIYYRNFMKSPISVKNAKKYTLFN